MSEHTDLTLKIRNDYLLNWAYRQGQQNGLDELEILKRFTVFLLELKDEAVQEKLDELMKTAAPNILGV